MAAGIWSSLVGVILFVATAYLTLQVVIPAMGGFQGSFETTICKFNAWMRASTVGNPLFESLIGASDFITGGFGAQIATSVTVPLVCTEAVKLPSPDDGYYSLNVVVDKIVRESVNCWDQFGLGSWDPLVLSSEGQAFTCFKQLLPIKCTPEDITSLWPELTSDLQSRISDPQKFTADLLHYYLETHSFSFAGLDKTYADVLPEGAPVVEAGSYSTTYFECDNEVHKYYVSLYFIDSFMGGISGVKAIPLSCTTITDLGSDSLYMCIDKY